MVRVTEQLGQLNQAMLIEYDLLCEKKKLNTNQLRHRRKELNYLFKHNWIIILNNFNLLYLINDTKYN